MTPNFLGLFGMAGLAAKGEAAQGNAAPQAMQAARTIAESSASRATRVAGVLQDGYRHWLDGMAAGVENGTRFVSGLSGVANVSDLAALNHEWMNRSQALAMEQWQTFMEISSRLSAEMGLPKLPAPEVGSFGAARAAVDEAAKAAAPVAASVAAAPMAAAPAAAAPAAAPKAATPVPAPKDAAPKDEATDKTVPVHVPDTDLTAVVPLAAAPAPAPEIAPVAAPEAAPAPTVVPAVAKAPVPTQAAPVQPSKAAAQPASNGTAAPRRKPVPPKGAPAQ